MTDKPPRFLVGKGKPSRRPRPEAPRTEPEAEAPARRFFVGDGSKAPPPVPSPVPPSRAYPVRANGCICARPEATGHVPGCKFWEDAVYECEPADVKTIVGLAKLASTSIADLERRRRGWLDPPTDCPDVVREGRRRCWRCPWWDRANATPIQLAYEDITDAALQGSTPPEGEDDGLPF